jgi:hypothetical protein
MLIISKMGLDLTLTCLSGISVVSQKIYSSIATIVTNKNENTKIKDFIDGVDILSTIKIIENFIGEIVVDDTTPITVSTCINEIFDILKRIEKEFDEIQNRLIYNSSLKVFKNIRSCKFDNSIGRLLTLKSILDSRINLLFKIIPMRNNLVKHESTIHDYLLLDNNKKD